MNSCHPVSDVVIRETMNSLNISTGNNITDGTHQYYQISSSSTQPARSLRVVPCLSNPTILDCVSLESTDMLGWYFRHAYYRAYLEPASNPRYPGGFNSDASFIILKDFFMPASVAFQSVNFPYRYITSVGDNQQMMILEYNNSSFYRNSSFIAMTDY